MKLNSIFTKWTQKIKKFKKISTLAVNLPFKKYIKLKSIPTTAQKISHQDNPKEEKEKLMNLLKDCMQNNKKRWIE